MYTPNGFSFLDTSSPTLVKFNSSGVRQWEVTPCKYGTTNSEVHSIGIDNNGRLLIAGRGATSTFQIWDDHATQPERYWKNTMDKGYIWENALELFSDGKAAVYPGVDSFYQIGVPDNSGDAGRSLIKIDGPSYSVDWKVNDAYPYTIFLQPLSSVAADSSGNVVVGISDATLQMYNNSGTQQFSATHRASSFNDVIVGVDGTSFYSAIVGGNSGTDSLKKWNSSGVEQWSADYSSAIVYIGGFLVSNARAEDLFVTSSGSSFIAGGRGTDDGTTYFSVKEFDSSGSLVNSFDTGANASFITVDSSGNFYVDGGNGLKKYNSSGVLQWDVALVSSFVTSLVVDGSENVFVSGITRPVGFGQHGGL